MVKNELYEGLIGAIETCANIIKSVNEENISEEYEDLKKLDIEDKEQLEDVLGKELLQKCIDHNITLYYSEIAGFYPYSEYVKENMPFKNFLHNYANEICAWADAELKQFVEVNDDKYVYETLLELADTESDKQQLYTYRYLDDYFNEHIVEFAIERITVREEEYIFLTYEKSGFGYDFDAKLIEEDEIKEIQETIKEYDNKIEEDESNIQNLIDELFELIFWRN